LFREGGWKGCDTENPNIGKIDGGDLYRNSSISNGMGVELINGSCEFRIK
jgi:hypothetical protein